VWCGVVCVCVCVCEMSVTISVRFLRNRKPTESLPHTWQPTANGPTATLLTKWSYWNESISPDDDSASLMRSVLFIQNVIRFFHTTFPALYSGPNKTGNTQRYHETYSVSIVTGHRLYFCGNVIRFLAGPRKFSLVQRVRTGPEAHSSSYTMGIGGHISGVKHPVGETHHSRAGNP